MLFSILFRRWTKKADRTPVARPSRRCFTPRLEVLEDRLTPSTLTVTNLKDTAIAGDGSLRGELAAAQSGDTIQFQQGLHGSIFLGSTLNLMRNVNIQGNLDSAGQPLVALDGQHTVRDVFVNTGVTAALANVGIANGYIPGEDIGLGGGILNDGTLTVQSCKITGNVAGSTYVFGVGDAGSAVGNGGGISNQGTLTVQNSILSGNTAGGFGSGGAIYNGWGRWVRLSPTGVMQWQLATTTMTGCTITGNAATWGVSDAGGGTTIKNTTITGNTATLDAGGVYIHPTQNMLATSVNASATTVSVISANYFAKGQTILIDNERMIVTGVDTVHNTLTVTRGVNGSTAVAHAGGAKVTDLTSTLDAFTLAHLLGNSAPSNANFDGQFLTSL
jgi:hypothetical protein